MHNNEHNFGKGCKTRIFFSLLTILIVLFVPSSPLLVLGKSLLNYQGLIMLISIVTFWIFAYKILSNWYFNGKDIDSLLYESLESESTI